MASRIIHLTICKQLEEVLEVEDVNRLRIDPIYSGEWEMTAQLDALQYLKWCRGGNFISNPCDTKK